jgi:oxygen-independent coproporphyrinogen-3 oxidase
LPLTSHDSYPIPRFTAADVPRFTEFFGMLEGENHHADNMIHVRIPADRPWAEEGGSRYVTALRREIRSWARLPYVRDMPFAAVHIRGLPPDLTVDHVARLCAELRESFVIAPGATWNFDADSDGRPTADVLGYLAGADAKRISLPIGTFDVKLRETMRVWPDVPDVFDMLGEARAAGIEHVDVEMAYALPGQDLVCLEQDLTELVERNFDNVTYRRLSSWPRPTELSMEMTRYVRERLVQSGYHHVAAPVFANSPDTPEHYRILHGGGYGEHRAQTLAIGASAQGYLNGYSYANTRELDAYIAHTGAESSLPVQLVSAPLADRRNRGAVFFPRFFRVEWLRLPGDTHTRSVIDRLLGQGYATDDGDTISLTEHGKDRISVISAELFEPEQLALIRRLPTSVAPALRPPRTTN